MSFSARLPSRVRVVEVGPRDGLQNERQVLSVEAKVRFIEGLAAAGFPVIEAGAFVRPDRIPQMADTDLVFGKLHGLRGPVLSALVPNRQGMERALQCGVREVAVFTAASEAFTRHNINMGIDESLTRFRDVLALAKPEGVRVRAYISTAWWCPYTGRVAPDSVRRVGVALVEMGCYEISLGDTIGAATPAEVTSLLERLARDLPLEGLAVHFHDTRGTALANVLAALASGIATVDSSAGGLGGCPFAPGASGNLATEDLLYMLQGMGIGTGVDLAAVAGASKSLEGPLGHPLPSRYLQAGPLQARGD
ncbi:MAG: hydroxymethylglutaryl-CoA lyase [Bacillati bacterium ANGP1]|uniref:Hydroxymethylglutaryl-CoA lyase n=1 Tax=Candidatus Segetimicrobium genomatis TaxID=2569760 RepID=A0A537J272_9BACT|nr:MAG: hydroxymethylglutaryl-CoA lyase [Terrabacteria group bacterium ANGP1]